MQLKIELYDDWLTLKKKNVRILTSMAAILILKLVN